MYVGLITSCVVHFISLRYRTKTVPLMEKLFTYVNVSRKDETFLLLTLSFKQVFPKSLLFKIFLILDSISTVGYRVNGKGKMKGELTRI